MEETKRIELTTVGQMKKDRKTKETQPPPPTYRFQLTLGESNDKTCPEFNYSNLVGKASRKNIKNGGIENDVQKEDGDFENHSADPFGDEDDDEKMKELARKFEEKYAPKADARKSGKFGRVEDYIDLGMGYDETDPFIDNSDAYDELVPSTLTTQHGGFYINTGKLDFKELNQESSDDDIQDPVKRKRRRKLKEIEKDIKRKKKLLMKDGDVVPKKRGRKPMERADSAFLKPRKKQPTVAALLQHHKAQQQKKVIPTFNSAVSLSSSTTAVSHSVTNETGSTAKRESNGAELQLVGSSSSDSDGIIYTHDIANESEVVPKPPEGLPDFIDEAVKHIKEAALKSEGKRFFSEDINKLLLNIDNMSRELSCSLRSQLYGYLASHLPCTKETLLKRVRKLRLMEENGKLREPMKILKKAIDEVMLLSEDAHKIRCRNSPEGSIRVVEVAESEEEKSDDFEDIDAPSSPSEEEGDDGIKIVRKKFLWNDTVRRLLCNVVQIKMKAFELAKGRTQTAEEYLREFLSTQMKPLWPKGWMTVRKLIRESRSAHAHLTYRLKPSMVAIKKFLPAVSLLPLASLNMKIASTMNETSATNDQQIQTSTQSSSVTVTTPALKAASAPSVIVITETETTPTNTNSSISQRKPTSNSTSDAQVGVKMASLLLNAHSTAVSSASKMAALSPQPTINMAGKSSAENKTSNRGFSLFDAAAVTAIGNSDLALSGGKYCVGGVSSAKDFLSEIINRSLADYPNSESTKLLANYRYLDGPKFSAGLTKSSTANVTTSRTSPSLEFTYPKTGVKLSSSSTSNNLTPKVDAFPASSSSTAKEGERHHHQRTSSSTDFRSSQRSSPLDLYLADCFPQIKVNNSTNKTSMTPSEAAAAAAASFHSLYDIKGAIERGLKGSHTSSSQTKAWSQTSATSAAAAAAAAAAALYAAASSEEPLNFSTPKSSKSTAQQSASQDRSKSSPSPASTTSPSTTTVRMVNLPKSHSPFTQISSTSTASSSTGGKYSGTSRTLPKDQEGIAASWQDFHLKKSVKMNERSTPSTSTTNRSIVGGTSHVKSNSVALPSSHRSVALSNHNLPNTSNSYQESVHSISQVPRKKQH